MSITNFSKSKATAQSLALPLFSLRRPAVQALGMRVRLSFRRLLVFFHPHPNSANFCCKAVCIYHRVCVSRKGYPKWKELQAPPGLDPWTRIEKRRDSPSSYRLSYENTKRRGHSDLTEHSGWSTTCAHSKLSCKVQIP